MKNRSMADIILLNLRVRVDQIHLPAYLAAPGVDQSDHIRKVNAPGPIKIATTVGRRMDLHRTGVRFGGAGGAYSG